jgi:hypothetical protein
MVVADLDTVISMFWTLSRCDNCAHIVVQFGSCSASSTLTRGVHMSLLFQDAPRQRYHDKTVIVGRARHEALRAKFGFTCLCRLCSLPPEQNQENDRRLDEIYRLDGLIGRGGIEGILSSPLRTLRTFEHPPSPRLHPSSLNPHPLHPARAIGSLYRPSFHPLHQCGWSLSSS